MEKQRAEVKTQQERTQECYEQHVPGELEKLIENLWMKRMKKTKNEENLRRRQNNK